MFSWHIETRHNQLAFGWKAHPSGCLNELADYITRYTWSPCLYKDGHRKQIHFIGADMMALDFDDGYPTLHEAQLMFWPYKHLIATTKSHQVKKGDKPACDRFRVVLCFEDIITDMYSYRASVAPIVKEYGSDQKPKDAARFFFQCKDIISLKLKGETLAIKKGRKPDKTKQKKISEHFKKTGPQKIEHFPSHIQHFFRFGTRPGERNDSVFKVAIYLISHGYSQQQAIDMIESVDFNRTDWQDNETQNTVESAFRTFNESIH